MKHLLAMAALTLGLSVAGTAQAHDDHGSPSQNYGRQNYGRQYHDDHSHGHRPTYQRGFQLYLNQGHNHGHNHGHYQYNQGFNRYNNYNRGFNNYNHGHNHGHHHNHGHMYPQTRSFQLYIGR